MKKIIPLILVVTMLFIGSGFAQAEDILGDAEARRAHLFQRRPCGFAKHR